MNPLIAFVALASVANAVKFVGHTPSISQYNTIEALSKSIFEETGASIHSVLRTDTADSDDMAKFLTGGGFSNMTIADLRAQNAPLVVYDLEARDSVTTACTTQSKITLSPSAAAQYQICTVLTTLTGGAGAGLAYILQNVACNVSENGHRTFCNAVFIITSTTATGLSAMEVSHFCPQLFNSVNSGCSGKGGDAQQQGKEFLEALTQNPISCRDETGDTCTQSSFQA